MTNRDWQHVEYNILGRMHAEGKTDADVASILGREERDVRRARARLGLESKAAGSAWSDIEVSCLNRLWENGKSDAEIAEHLGRTIGSTRAKREALGLVCYRNATMVRRLISASDVLNLAPLRAEERDATRRAYSNAAFLISLLRAGHKPGQGEFAIASENRPVPHCYLVGA